MIQVSPFLWAGFLGLVIGILLLDLLVLGAHSKKTSFKSALAWSAVWVSLAAFFGFGLALWGQAGPAAASKFASGYILELSLSVDNLFVFILIFSQYKVPAAYHRKVLFWGILGALILRALFIGLGSAAVQRWHWLLLVFGLFLAYTGISLLFEKEGQADPSKSLVVRLAHRFFRVSDHYEGDRFFFRKKAVLWATPLLLVVLIIEATDVVFALDSIPAVFGVTTDPFLVYTSNIFAILGLRSMFFALEGVMHRFRYLRVGLAVILTLIGLKMLLLEWLEARLGFHAGEAWTLGAIALILAASMAFSLLQTPGKHRPQTKRRKLQRRS